MKAFLEKYPEFDEKVFHTEEIPKDIDLPHIQLTDVKEILDKHFVRKSFVGTDNHWLLHWIEKKKVKDAFIKFIKIDKEKRKSKGDTWEYGDSMMELRLFELARKLKIDKELGLK